MSIFTKKPPYTTEQIAQQVTNLEHLEKQYGTCKQNIVVCRNAGQNADVLLWETRAYGYHSNILTAQKCLDYMQGKVVGKG